MAALTAVSLRNLMSSVPTPVGFVVDSIVPRGVVTLLAAHGGSGKSVLSLTIAAHVAAGCSWAGLQVKKGKAVFVSLEDPGDLVRCRLRRIIEACNLPADAVLSRLAVLDGCGVSSGLMCEASRDGQRLLVESEAMASLRGAADGADLVVIDNASDAADFDENSRRHVRQFVRTLAGVARENNAGLILLAHIDKAAARNGSNGESYSGSTAWHNSARSRLALSAKDGVVELAHEKANLSRPARARLFAWTDTGILVPTTDELAQAKTQALDAIRATKDADDVLAAIQRAEAAGATVYTGRSGSYSALCSLRTFDIPRDLMASKGERFWRALDSLVSDRRVAAVEFKNNQRNVRAKYVPVAAEALRCRPPITPSTAAQQGCCSAALDQDSDCSASAAAQQIDGQLAELLHHDKAPCHGSE